jgi:hypothetical protein
MEDATNRCFSQVVPRTNALQHASHFRVQDRAYDSKYPGESGIALRNLCLELLDRLDEANAASAGRTPPRSAVSLPR